MDARNSIDPGILLFLPTAGGGTVICQYFSKAAMRSCSAICSRSFAPARKKIEGALADGASCRFQISMK